MKNNCDKNAASAPAILTSVYELLRPGRRFPYILGALAFAIVLVGLVSCSEDVRLKGEQSDIDDTTLTLFIPDAETAKNLTDDYLSTRALEDAAEAKINTLWFFAYPYDDTGRADNKRKTLIKNLNPASYSTVDGYRKYTVGGLEPGGYKFYLLANLESYLSPNTLSEEKEITETVLRKLTLDYTNKLPEYGNLPMACMPEEVKSSIDGEPLRGNGVFIFEKGNDGKYNKEIYADLTFQCSKVRYTILFDKDAFSKNFPSSEINFDETVNTSKVPRKKILDGSIDQEFLTSLPTYNLFKVSYPQGTNGEISGYLKDTPTYEDDLLPISNGQWANDTQRAWQGIAYLPENQSTTSSDKTKLTFTGSGPGLKSSYSFTLFENTILEHGKFYDVVATLEEVDKEEMTANVAVSNWTTQNLDYSLHGPHKLIVEDTKLKISSGKWTVMGYESDDEVSFISPTILTIQGEDLFTIQKITSEIKDDEGYVFEDLWPSHLRITINPELSYEDLRTQNLDELQFFEIKVGNLYKRIEIEELINEPYLNLKPQNIVIDVKEMTASGINSTTYAIDFATNLNVGGISGGSIFTLTGANDLLGYNESSAIWLQDHTGILESITGETIPILSNVGCLYLNVTGILSGNPFWNIGSSYDLVFTLQDSAGNIYRNSKGEELNKTLTIQVFPPNP